ncbi:MAG: glycosyltransferase [Syntrophomonadaceae bacterium]|jgi:glycosyltransferase involved in cell wall biosynthesis|nr:glycosyltransferase family 4 protein [Bacillota bacterium]NLM88316.1 glycosyltransferase [Syntrophomonadaceae bacterium]HAA08603.1 glycosyl transferase family 1 [Syntrophomonas sp.]HQD91424.1 glycosyltransferase family 4 protein [Syntrophomonadaceae bacterium]
MTLINVGSYPPKQCGIATFSQDLRKSLIKAGHTVSVAAVSDQEYEYHYGAEVVTQIRQHEKNDYLKAAAQINNNSAINVVIIQHEYGIYGGPDGSYLLNFCAALQKPFIVVTHTVLPNPDSGRYKVLVNLTELAAAVVCMTENSAALLQQVYQVPSFKLHMISHGVPDFLPKSPQALKRRYHLQNRNIITTFGLIGPGKGLELGIRAVADVLSEYPDCLYLIIGQTHPMLQRSQGEKYRQMLEQLVDKLGISENVKFINRFLSDEELGDYLYLTDIYLSPYPNLDQAVSGTLTFAVGTGRAIVSTPYAHAVELLADNRGLLTSQPDYHQLAQLMKAILSDPELKTRLQNNARKLGHTISWTQVGRRYSQVLQQIIDNNFQEGKPFHYA